MKLIPSILHTVIITAPIAFLLCGCAGTQHGTASPQQLLVSRQAEMIEEINKLREELRSLKSSQEESDYRVSDEVLKQPLQEAIGRCTNRIDTLEERLNSMEKEVSSNRAAWNKKMEKVLEVVKSENMQLRESIEKLQKSSVSSGWEHTVSPGETLGKIAREYGVRTNDIVEANDLENPNEIRPGQVLFIPRGKR